MYGERAKQLQSTLSLATALSCTVGVPSLGFQESLPSLPWDRNEGQAVVRYRDSAPKA